MQALLSPVLLFLTGALVDHVVLVSAERLLLPPPPLDRYDFCQCSDSYNEKLNQNVTFLYGALRLASLTGDRSTLGDVVSSDKIDFMCHPTKGTNVMSALRTRKYSMASNATITKFQQQFAHAGNLTISLWLYPADGAHSQDTRPIMTIGETAFNPIFIQECQGFDFRIAQSGKFLSVSFTSSDGICEHLKVEPLPLVSELTHVVVAFGPASMQVYYNGKAAFPPDALSKTVDVRSWTTSNTLQFFSNHQDENPFQGHLIQVDIYDQELSPNEVATLFARSFGNMDDLVDANGGDNRTKGDDNSTAVDETIDSANGEGNSTDGEQDNLNKDDDDIAEKGDESSGNFEFRLVARPPDPVAIPQNGTEGREIVLGSYNKSTWNMRLAFQITTVPTHGSLLYGNGTLAANDTIAIDGDFAEGMDAEDWLGVTMNYVLNGIEYFNSPPFDGRGVDLRLPPESFTFRVVSFHPFTTDINLATDPIEVPIHVLHVNHGPPTLIAPYEATLDRDNPFRASVGQIEVMDHPLDFNIDVVRVEVMAEGGTLSLNSNHLHLADFNCSGGSWICSGTGAGSQVMNFIAVPEDLTRILDGMVFESFHSSQGGDIRISIYDGVNGDNLDGDCLEAQQFQKYAPYNTSTKDHPVYGTEHFGLCSLTQATIFIPLYGEESIGQHSFSTSSGSNSSNSSGGYSPGADPLNGPGGFAVMSRGEEDGEMYILGYEWPELASGMTGVFVALFFMCGWRRHAFMSRRMARGRQSEADAPQGA